MQRGMLAFVSKSCCFNEQHTTITNGGKWVVEHEEQEREPTRTLKTPVPLELESLAPMAAMQRHGVGV